MEKSSRTLKIARTVSVSAKAPDGHDSSYEQLTDISAESYENIISSIMNEKGTDRYKILKIIGKGGMKTVFKTKERITCRNVAMAVLTEADKKRKDVARFIHEAKITANLEHPNIVPVHEIGINSFGEPYFTMKLAGGEDLCSIVDKLADGKPEYKSKFTLCVKLDIFRKICDAVAFAHAKGVLHLDLKPENIQVGDFGEVLVIDWGLAKIKADQHQDSSDGTEFSKMDMKNLTDKTLDGLAKGTPGYMAPEQAAGKNMQKDERTDIYALGGILYSLFTFRKPIEGEDLNDVLVRTIRGELVAPRKLMPALNIPKAIEAVVMKAMERCPEDRYQTVSELRQDLDSFAGGFATKAEKAGFLTHLLLMVKRNWAIASIIILCLLSALAIAGMWGFHELKLYANWGAATDITPRGESQFKEDWIVKSGVWKLKRNSIYSENHDTDEPDFVIYYKKPFYGNIALEFDASVENEDALQAGGDLSAMLLSDIKTDERYDMQVGSNKNALNSIQRGRDILISEPFSLKAGRKYKIRVEKEDDWLRLYIDDKLRISCQDIFNLKGGCVGFYTYGVGKHFSNIRIYQKGSPELVSPLNEGDAFYNRSRGFTGEMRNNYLKDALDSYAKVYESHRGKELGKKSLFKRAYVNAELGRYDDAATDLKSAKSDIPALQELIFEGDLWFRAQKYRLALDAYQKASNEFPDKRDAVSSVIKHKIKNSDKMGISNELLKEYVKLSGVSPKEGK